MGVYSICVGVHVCMHACIHVCQGVIMENKGLVVQSETVGFEVRWEMLFCLAEQTQWSHSTSPLTAHCPPATNPTLTAVGTRVEAWRRKKDVVLGNEGRELLLNLMVAGGEVRKRQDLVNENNNGRSEMMKGKL